MDLDSDFAGSRRMVEKPFISMGNAFAKADARFPTQSGQLADIQ